MNLELEEHDEPVPVTPFLAAKAVAPLCNELASVCSTALQAGTLLQSIADLACLRAILAGAPDAWNHDGRRRRPLADGHRGTTATELLPGIVRQRRSMPRDLRS